MIPSKPSSSKQPSSTPPPSTPPTLLPIIQSAYESIAEPIIVIQEPDARILFANSTLCTVLETTLDLIRGQKLKGILPEIKDTTGLFTDDGKEKKIGKVSSPSLRNSPPASSKALVTSSSPLKNVGASAFGARRFKAKVGGGGVVLVRLAVSKLSPEAIVAKGDELGCLGRGGFGVVYRGRNKLDGQEYAIKKVKLNCKPEEFASFMSSTESLTFQHHRRPSNATLPSPSSSSILTPTAGSIRPGLLQPPTVNTQAVSPKTRTAVVAADAANGPARRLSEADSRLLKEVKLFAKLSNHPNVVNYHTAWIEAVEGTGSETERDDEDEDGSSNDEEEDGFGSGAAGAMATTATVTTTTTTMTTMSFSASTTSLSGLGMGANASVNAMMMKMLTTTTTTSIASHTSSSDSDIVVFHDDSPNAPTSPTSATSSSNASMSIGEKSPHKPGSHLRPHSLLSSALSGADPRRIHSNVSIASSVSSSTTGSAVSVTTSMTGSCPPSPVLMEEDDEDDEDDDDEDDDAGIQFKSVQSSFFRKPSGWKKRGALQKKNQVSPSLASKSHAHVLETVPSSATITPGMKRESNSVTSLNASSPLVSASSAHSSSGASSFEISCRESSDEDVSDDVGTIRRPPRKASNGDVKAADGKKKARNAPLSPKKKHNATLFIQMQLCPFKDLRRWISERENVDRATNLEIVRQIVDGLVHVHAHNVIHRDLKPENIFISEDRHILLGDFGLAKSIAEYILSPFNNMYGDDGAAEVDSSTDQGTYLYIAPEILNHQMCTTRSDIYSLGILMVELFHVFETAMERAVTLNDLKTKGSIPSSIPHDVADLVERLVHPDPASRPSALEILSDPLFGEIMPATATTVTYGSGSGSIVGSVPRGIPIRHSSFSLSSSYMHPSSGSPSSPRGSPLSPAGAVCQFCSSVQPGHQHLHQHQHANRQAQPVPQGGFRPGTSAPSAFMVGYDQNGNPRNRYSPPSGYEYGENAAGGSRSVRRTISSYTVTPSRRGSLGDTAALAAATLADEGGFIASGPAIMADDFAWNGAPNASTYANAVPLVHGQGQQQVTWANDGDGRARAVRHSKSVAANIGGGVSMPQHLLNRRMRSFSGQVPLQGVHAGASHSGYQAAPVYGFLEGHGGEAGAFVDSPTALSSSSSTEFEAGVAAVGVEESGPQIGRRRSVSNVPSGFPSLSTINTFFGSLFKGKNGEEQTPSPTATALSSGSLPMSGTMYEHLLSKRKSLPTISLNSTFIPERQDGMPDFTAGLSRPPQPLGDSPPLAPGETPKDRIRALEEDVSVLVARLEAMHARQMVMEAELEGRAAPLLHQSSHPYLPPSVVVSSAGQLSAADPGRPRLHSWGETSHPASFNPALMQGAMFPGNQGFNRQRSPSVPAHSVTTSKIHSSNSPTTATTTTSTTPSMHSTSLGNPTPNLASSPPDNSPGSIISAGYSSPSPHSLTTDIPVRSGFPIPVLNPPVDAANSPSLSKPLPPVPTQSAQPVIGAVADPLVLGKMVQGSKAVGGWAMWESLFGASAAGNGPSKS
ncbi:hypothetical protein HDU97_001703 [Phlyctochytrium planicorne]|nr:hypothetical protein HDU97_001703 [Phlyctochytrium planicorne]